MKLFKIFLDTDPVLHEKCKEVETPLSDEIRQTALDMVEYLKASQDDMISQKYHIRSGVGIAAPQIGIAKRFFAVYFEDNDKVYEYGLINPVILSTSVKKAYLASGEGCLSVPKDKKGHVYRYFKITIKGFDVVSNKEVTLKLHGYPAIVFQHEYDHLDGVLYYDRIDKENPMYDDSEAVCIE